MSKNVSKVEVIEVGGPWTAQVQAVAKDVISLEVVEFGHKADLRLFAAESKALRKALKRAEKVASK